MNFENLNQKAINEFFEAFGTDTVKEYNSTIMDLLTIVLEKDNLTNEYKEDIYTKLKDLNRLISQLMKLENVLPHTPNGYMLN